MSRYDFLDLFFKAVSSDATQADLDNLGEWFQEYNQAAWNGEYFDCGCGRNYRLYPTYVSNGDDFIISGYHFA